MNETHRLTGVGGLEVRFLLVEGHSLLSVLKGIVRFSKVEVCGVNFGNDPENCTVRAQLGLAKIFFHLTN